MRALIVLAALGWLMSLPWMALFAYLALIVAALVVMWLLAVSTERRVVSNSSGGNATDPNYVAALEAMVTEAETQVAALRVEVEQLRASHPASEHDPKAALYRRVGLNENAPPWLVAAARRAYRAALHPDRHPAHRKLEAERRFKLAENVFDEIASLRL